MDKNNTTNKVIAVNTQGNSLSYSVGSILTHYHEANKLFVIFNSNYLLQIESIKTYPTLVGHNFHANDYLSSEELFSILPNETIIVNYCFQKLIVSAHKNCLLQHKRMGGLKLQNMY